MTYTFRVIDSGNPYDLPDIQGCSLGYEFSDVGVLNMSYIKGGVNYSRLGDNKVVIAYWNGVEQFDSRFIIQAGDTDDDPEVDTEKWIGKSLMDVFRRVVVEEIAGKPGLPVRFDTSTPGAIMINLFTAAQARGAMTGITWNFTAAVDSNGTPWPMVINIEYALGLKYLDFMRNMVDQGLVEFRFNGTQLQAFIADTMGTDRTTGATPLELQAGLDYTELPRKWTSEERAKFSMALGDDGAIVRTTDGSVPDGPFGREEMAISQGGTSDINTLTIVNQAALDRVKQTREQLTRKVIIRENGKVPTVDYRVSDWINERITEGTGSNATSSSARYRIRSMVVETDEDGGIGTASIVLNDKFLEAQIRIARKVNGIIGGANAEGGGNGVPVDERPDTTTPNPPTGLISNSDTVVTPSGIAAIVAFDWNPPVLNTDGSALTDLKDFEHQWRYSTGQTRRNLCRNPNYRKTNGVYNVIRRNYIINPAMRGGGATTVLRTNLATNPSAESATLNWPSNNGAVWTHTLDTTVKRSGAQSVKSVPVTPGSSTTILSMYNVGGGVFPVTAGEYITASVYVAALAGVAATAQLSISWLDASLAVVGTTLGTTITGVVADQTFVARPFASGQAPAGATQFRLGLTINRSSGNTVAGDAAWADDCLIEKTQAVMSAPAGFFSGASAAANGQTFAWTSTANASTSTASGIPGTGWSASGQFPTRVDLGGGLYGLDFRGGFVNYSNPASVGVVGEFWAGKVTVQAIPGETPAGATVQVRIHDGTGYTTPSDPPITIPSDGSTVTIDNIPASALTGTAPRLYVYSAFPFRLRYAIMEKVAAANTPCLDWFDGSMTYKNLATSYSTLGNGTVVTPNVSFGGKKWTRIKHPTSGFGARMNVALADLQNGASYTVSATVYNESDSAVLIACEWVDGGSQGPSAGFYTLQPKETRRIKGINSRSVYDSVYRFHDIEFQSAFNGSVLVTDVLIEAGTVAHTFWAGTLTSRDGLQSAWVGSADASESVLQGLQVTYGFLGEYAGTAGSKGWSSGYSYHLAFLRAISNGEILAFDRGGGSTAAQGKWYAARFKVRSVNGQAVTFRPTLGQYNGSGSSIGWFNDGLAAITTAPASGDWIEVSLPAAVVGASGVATARAIMYSSGTTPINSELEIKDTIVEEVAGFGYTTSNYFDGSSAAGNNFKYAWAGVKDDSFSDKILNVALDNNWRTSIVTDSDLKIDNIIPDTVLEWRVRARDDAGGTTTTQHVSTWATAFALVTGDSYGPPAPSMPQLFSKLGTVTVTWDGTTTSGDPMPPDFDKVEVHMSDTSGFTPSVSTYQDFLKAAGAIIVTGLPGGVTRYFKFLAVDQNGNDSEESPQASVVVNRIAGPDLQANSVTTNELSVGAVHAENVELGVMRSNLMADPSFEDDYEITEVWEPFTLQQIGNTRHWRLDNVQPASVIVRKTRPQDHRARSGARGLEMSCSVAGETGSVVSPALAVEPGKTYVLAFYACSLFAQARMGIAMMSGNGDEGSPWYFSDLTLTGDTDTWTNPPIISDPPDTEAMQQYSYQFTVPATGVTYTALRFQNYGSDVGSILFADDFSIVEYGSAGASELTAAGLRLFGPDGTEIGAFVSNRPNYFSVQRDGATVASIDQSGVISGKGMSIEGTDSDGDGVADSGFEVYGREITDLIKENGLGIRAFGYRTTTPTSYSATEAPYQQVDATVYAGRLYRIGAKGYLNGDTAGMRGLVKLHANYAGTAAQITDTQLMTQRVTIPTTGGSMPFMMIHHWAYRNGPPDGTSADLSVLLSYMPESAGNVRITASITDSCEVWIEDMGIYYGDVGIDRAGGTPPPTKKTYVKTYTTTTGATYKGDGSKRTDTTDIVQGYNSYNGNGKGLWIFPSMTADLAGSTVSKVEIYAYANHWYYNSGGTARIHLHGYSSAPASSPSLTYCTQSSGWPKPGGRWVTLPSSFYAGFISGAYRGFGMGPAPSNDLLYYGRFNRGGAQIRVTYIK